MDEETGKVIGIVAVVVLVLGGLALLANGRRGEYDMYDADTDTRPAERNEEKYDPISGQRGTCGYGGEHAVGGGQFPDLPDDARTSGELASSQVLWMSWFFDGQSSPVSFAGRLAECEPGVGIGPPEGVYYRLSYSEDGTGWTGFVQDRNPSGSVRLDTAGGGFAPRTWDAPVLSYTIDGYTFRECTYPGDADASPFYVSKSVLTCTPGETRTIVEGATLRVEMFTYQRTVVEGEGFWRYFVKDELVLLSALPKRLEWQKGACAVGSTCVLDWEIPTDRDAGGNATYFLSLLDENTNTPLDGYERKPLSGTSGQERILITQAMFSKDLETCANRIRAVIYTTLVPVGVDEVAVQDLKEISAGAPPRIHDIAFDKTDYQEGDTVKLSWKVDGNVTKTHVTIALNGQIIYDRYVDAGVRNVEVVAPFPGYGDAELTPMDYCNPGSVEEAHFVVGNVFPGLCDLFPGLAQCTAANAWAWAFAVLGIVLLLIAFFAALWVVDKLEIEDLPPWARLLIAFLVLAAVAAVLIKLGAFDALLGVGIVRLERPVHRRDVALMHRRAPRGVA